MLSKSYFENKEVPSLLELCTRVLIKKKEKISSIGDIPLHLLDPIFCQCTAEQLLKLEKINPFILKQTDKFWESLFNQKPEKYKKEVLDSANSKQLSWKKLYEEAETLEAKHYNEILIKVRDSSAMLHEKRTASKVKFTNQIPKKALLSENGKKYAYPDRKFVRSQPLTPMEKVRKEILVHASYYGVPKIKNIHSNIITSTPKSKELNPVKKISDKKTINYPEIPSTNNRSKLAEKVAKLNKEQKSLNSTISVSLLSINSNNQNKTQNKSIKVIDIPKKQSNLITIPHPNNSQRLEPYYKYHSNQTYTSHSIVPNSPESTSSSSMSNLSYSPPYNIENKRIDVNPQQLPPKKHILKPKSRKNA
ncbi:hypothetical protein BB559_004391 [Furculomyces boomerangus]|uniref:Elongin-A n=1 Tax=Furculomyces boomerangus TaxID=61424 RepID=A0A2T9YEZ7_9FUNG|nr:hypothetical protein BB559_004391 [Furculomyces boomerangus]